MKMRIKKNFNKEDLKTKTEHLKCGQKKQMRHRATE